ncbi:uncharacterized protein LAESUDRAFT_516247 [Laetiporus sulphureus 93-53]|uniref:Uncharacterized protein n=1 Tax=Laetiporus sulphureus 93-53 TaxID=1314785 RepID=A0A165G0W5_9APHY|nr:uncharacterized protein LAESUDRAFT_516247 [Laetiporus sulphureus 93-53]KZT09681.1 hypothetical protein LAESUDRAFT_516247 [Laetiporus sulphureus 93-53]
MWNEWASAHCVEIHEESRGCPLESFFTDLITSFRFPIDVADPDFADGLLRDQLGPEWKVKIDFMVYTNQLGPENPFFKKRARELMTSYLTFRNALMDQSNEAGLRRGVDNLLDLVWTYSGLQETLYKVKANLALPCPFLNQAPKNATADGIVTYDLLSAENIDLGDLGISRSWCVDISSEDRPRSYQPIVMAFETKADASNVNTRTGLHQLVTGMAAALHHRISLVWRVVATISFMVCCMSVASSVYTWDTRQNGGSHINSTLLLTSSRET